LKSYSWALACRFFSLGLPGPGPGAWLPFPSNFCFLGLWRDEADGSGSLPIFRKRLSPFLSCQSVRICQTTGGRGQGFIRTIQMIIIIIIIIMHLRHS